jgi:hypothetical protein
VTALKRPTELRTNLRLSNESQSTSRGIADVFACDGPTGAAEDDDLVDGDVIARRVGGLG